MAKTKTAATIRGIAIAPGISKNNRMYTREAIAKMVTRAQAQIGQESGLPLTMLTHHGAEDDSTRIVGKVTGMSLDESGAAHFTADIANTSHGKTVAKLVKGGFLRGVSIRGEWVGGSRTVKGPDGQALETGADISLTGLDYTARPGMPAARVVAESAPDGRTIREAAPVVVPVPAGPSLADLAAMPQETFDEHGGAYWGAKLTQIDSDRPRSPFMRGLSGGAA